MPQVIQCAGCSKKFKAADQLAGKKVRCPTCKAVLSIPALSNAAPAAAAPSPKPKPIAQLKPAAKPASAVEKPVKLPAATPAAAVPASAPKPAKSRDPFFDEDDEELRLAPELPPANPPPAALPAIASFPATSAAPRPLPRVPSSQRPVAFRPKPPESGRRRPRLLYLVFALAFLPLIFLSRDEDKDEVSSRIERTLEAQKDAPTPTTQNEKEIQLDEIPDDPEELLFKLFPDDKIDGALLPRHTWTHWLFALLAAGLFLTSIRLLFEPGRSTAVQLGLVALSTGTFGVLLLIMFQWLAELSQGFWLTRGGIVLIVFYLIKFIGWSYHAALSTDNGFLLSMIGFTFGVGLCEEICKAIPILCATNMERKLDWRGACAWGLASGVGFGVAEGIMYSSQFYNGLAGADIYLVRFLSCVALHASWSGAVAIMIWRHQDSLNRDTWYEWLFQILLLISVPMTMHGLYDTLLKREMKFYALLVALASFAWLAMMIERARRADDDEEEPLMVRRAAV